MKLVTYTIRRLGGYGRDDRFGALVNIGGEERVVSLPDLHRWAQRNLAPSDMHHRQISNFAPSNSLLGTLDRGYGATVFGEPDLIPTFDPLAEVRALLTLLADLADDDKERAWQLTIDRGRATLLPPLPRPRSLRDFYAFRAHVETARRNRGLPMIEEWFQAPAFYFSNHQAVIASSVPLRMPQTSALDYELEVACVVGRPGRNLTAEEAGGYIAGYMIMNDWSARDVQQVEMKVGLGPAKAKDFATTLGPALVTADELADRSSGVGAEERYDLAMTAKVNGELRSSGNMRDIHFSFSQLLAHASRDVWLYPGDVIASGTVGSGCLLELTAGRGPWLQAGDVVELEIERLGVITNPVVGNE